MALVSHRVGIHQGCWIHVLEEGSCPPCSALHPLPMVRQQTSGKRLPLAAPWVPALGSPEHPLHIPWLLAAAGPWAAACGQEDGLLPEQDCCGQCLRRAENHT